jgi:tetraacyldisaccharide 4'-kinase
VGAAARHEISGMSMRGEPLRASPRPRAPVPRGLGALIEPFYRMAIGARNRRFDEGRGIVRFDRVVISVGNLTVGGTGKTPMVAKIIGWLLEAGHRPVIAMRGYRAGTGESDEASVYRRAFPDVPVVAQANRTLGLIQQFAREYEAAGEVMTWQGLGRGQRARLARGEAGEADDTGAGAAEGEEVSAEPAAVSDCIVLDDGFQHRQIARDLDIVLIDATHDPFADRLLPAGWLREPVVSLKRAGAVVLTHAESASASGVAGLDQELLRVRGRSADAVARHEWAGLRVLDSGGDEERTAGWLAGRRAIAVCAIGNPGTFLEQSRRATGVPLAGELVLRDHDRYAARTVQRVVELARSTAAQAIVTTEKDWSKLSRVREWPCPVARPRLELGFERGGEALRQRVLEVVGAGAPE